VRLLERETRLLGDLLEGRLARELRPEIALRALHLLHPLDDVDGDADRPRLVRDGARDRLADPPGRVRRELEPPPPLELLDGADQAEHPLLDQVEEGQALVAVVLRDRDDEAQVALDHLPLRRHVAPLDPLRELDLLGGCEKGMATDLAQEKLQRVGRRLDPVVEVARRRRRLPDGLFRGRLDDLDPALLELALDDLDVGRLELERVRGLRQLDGLDEPSRLGLLEELLKLFGPEKRPDVVPHAKRLTLATSSAVPNGYRGENIARSGFRPRPAFGAECTRTGELLRCERGGWCLAGQPEVGPPPAPPARRRDSRHTGKG
jgi:hypothetical protein